MGPKGDEREKVVKNIFNGIMMKKFLNCKKERDIKVQEAKIVPKNKNPNRPRPRYIIIKKEKVRENSKGSKRKTKSCIQGTT